MTAGDVTSDGRARMRADGNEIPLLGLGVWQMRDGRECEDAVRSALEAGYRHLEQNAEGFDFTLSDQDMAALDALDTTAGTDGARERKWW